MRVKMFLCFLVIFVVQLTVASTAENDIDCIRLKHCPLALKLVETRRNDPTAVKFLRFTHCGFEGTEPKVWCNMFDNCHDPEGRKGKCISIRKCNSFINLLKKSDIDEQETRKHLNEYRCSTAYDPDIKVCCSQEEEKRNENCGVQSGDNRITGGVETNLDEYPWMALLRYQKALGGYTYGCGGSLISPKFVLTAGHCLDQIILKRKGLKKVHRIILGEYDTRNDTDCFYMKYGTDCADPTQEIEMESFIIHPGYMTGYTEHDIGIIRLRQQVQLTDFVSTICLPPADMELRKKDIFMIAGWGKTLKEKSSAVKRKARIDIVQKEKCSAFTEKPLDNSQICAGGTGDGVDACFGDSGGPLMLGRNVDNKFMNFVIGIVSHGFGSTCGEKPGVYTYVPYYVEWIQSNLVF